MVQFHPFKDVTKENIRGVQTLVQRKETVELFCGKLPGGGGGVSLKKG